MNIGPHPLLLPTEALNIIQDYPPTKALYKLRAIGVNISIVTIRKKKRCM